MWHQNTVYENILTLNFWFLNTLNEMKLQSQLEQSEAIVFVVKDKNSEKECSNSDKKKRLKLFFPLRFCSTRLFTIKGGKMGLKLLKCAASLL